MHTLTTVKFSPLIAFLLLLCSGSPVFAKSTPYQQSKKFEERFETSEQAHLSVKNKRGDIQIINIEGNEARVEVTLNVRGDSEVEIQKVIDQFSIDVRQTGNIVDLKAEDNIENWTIVKSFFRNSNSIKFNDKSKAKGIEEIDVAMVVYLPRIELLSAQNKYNDIIFSTLPCSLQADLYSGKLKGKNIEGDLELDMKYGEVNIGTFENGKFDIYDCNITAENGQKVKIKSKYSDIELGDLGSLTFDSYDDDIVLGTVTDNFDIEAKYSDIKMGGFKSSTMDLYDSDLKGKNGSSLDLTSKYGDFTFTHLEDVKLSLYDDNFSANEIKDLNIKSSKYSEIEVDNFKGYMSISSTYQDKIFITNTITDFKGLEMDGKYTTLKFPISSKVAYHLDADLKYGNIDFSDAFENTYTDKSDSKYEVKGKANGATTGAPKIKVKAYDSTIRFQ